MHPLESTSRLAEFAGKNIAYHLDFIADDRLAWKPEATAKSALEIVHHVSYFASGMVGVLGGGEFSPDVVDVPTDRATAQELIRSSSSRYAAALRVVDLARMGTTVDLPFGSFPFAMAATMPAFDLIHHHGQLAYIQTLLGDTEDHFDM
jgi:hypothetical protein